MQNFPVSFTAGDELPAISGILEGQDLTGYTITLNIKRPDPATVLTKTATIGDQTTALGSFAFPAWASDDLIAGLRQTCNIVFVNGGGQTTTSMQFTIDVDAAV